MSEYHKINTVFKRDPDNRFRTLLDGQYSEPEFELLQSIEWTFTEKVDGTNIRVIWDGEVPLFKGKTERADLPQDLAQYLFGHFTPDRLGDALHGPLVLYGEGYGGKIQSGGGYQQEQRFILFDAFSPPSDKYPIGVWLDRENVDGIGEALDIPVVPIIGTGPLLNAVDMCGLSPKSVIASDSDKPMEGLVMRPTTELRTRLGKRIITKIKAKDFQ